MKTKLSVPAAMLGLTYAVIAFAGIEQSTATGSTKADACNSALQTASASAGSSLFIEITEKKCDCTEDPKSITPYTRWSCIGFVTWRDKK